MSPYHAANMTRQHAGAEIYVTLDPHMLQKVPLCTHSPAHWSKSSRTLDLYVSGCQILHGLAGLCNWVAFLGAVALNVADLAACALHQQWPCTPLLRSIMWRERKITQVLFKPAVKSEILKES